MSEIFLLVIFQRCICPAQDSNPCDPELWVVSLKECLTYLHLSDSRTFPFIENYREADVTPTGAERITSSFTLMQPKWPTWA